MAWDLSHGASISILVLLSVSILLTLCVIFTTMWFNRRASGNNLELPERGEGQGGRSEYRSPEVHDARESEESRVEHRGQEDHPVLEGHAALDLPEHPYPQNHQGQDGHQSRLGHRNDEHSSPGERNSLRAIHEAAEAGYGR